MVTEFSCGSARSLVGHYSLSKERCIQLSSDSYVKDSSRRAGARRRTAVALSFMNLRRLAESVFAKKPRDGTGLPRPSAPLLLPSRRKYETPGLFPFHCFEVSSSL